MVKVLGVLLAVIRVAVAAVFVLVVIVLVVILVMVYPDALSVCEFGTVLLLLLLGLVVGVVLAATVLVVTGALFSCRASTVPL